MKDALNQTETVAYGGAVQLRQRIDRKGQLSGVTYDVLSRVKRVVEFTWDAGHPA